jgi:hypothetical protein
MTARSPPPSLAAYTTPVGGTRLAAAVPDQEELVIRVLSTRVTAGLLPVAVTLILAVTLSSPLGPVPSASAQAPSCAVGSWVAEDLGSVLAAVGATQGLSLANVNGTASLTVSEDGAYEIRMDNVTFQALVMGLPVSGTLNVSFGGVFTDLGDGTVLNAPTGGLGSVTVNILGRSITQEQDIPPSEGVVTTLSCDGDRMTTSAMVSETTLTQVWIRTG